MLPKSQQVHHVQQLTGIKGALHSVEQGLKMYNTLRGVYDVGKAVYQGVEAVAPIVAGLL